MTNGLSSVVLTYGSRTAETWVAYPAGMGISIGGLGVRAEVSGVGGRV
jgi:hypothetical protein